MQQGRLLTPDTGEPIGDGAVELSADRKHGNIYCLPKPDAWAGSREGIAILELDTGERLEVAIVGSVGPYVIRPPDKPSEEIGAPVTSFRVYRQL